MYHTLSEKQVALFVDNLWFNLDFKAVSKAIQLQFVILFITNRFAFIYLGCSKLLLGVLRLTLLSCCRSVLTGFGRAPQW